MVEGELMQLEQLGRIDVTEQEYSELVYRKTACLFSVCAQLGSVVASQTPEREKDLAEFGRNLGMAFQLVDDLLDFTADEATLGKPVGNDLREGKVTLPAIHTLSRCTPKERGLIATVVTERGFRTVSQREIVELIERYEAPNAVKRRAGEYIARALDHLEPFPDSPYKRALQAVPDFVLNRDK
jgi:octaprenyl-diphosphate synthase